jgi:hypothetical protein
MPDMRTVSWAGMAGIRIIQAPRPSFIDKHITNYSTGGTGDDNYFIFESVHIMGI